MLTVESKTAPASLDTARHAVNVASDKLAADIVMLDLRGVASFTDFFVVLTVESPRQMDSLAQEIESEVEELGASLHHREGTPHSGWMLLDFSDVIVHLFRPESREFYDIEDAWSEATEAVRIQ
jgi:ribosome-associated protein